MAYLVGPHLIVGVCLVLEQECDDEEVDQQKSRQKRKASKKQQDSPPPPHRRYVLVPLHQGNPPIRPRCSGHPKHCLHPLGDSEEPPMPVFRIIEAKKKIDGIFL